MDIQTLFQIERAAHLFPDAKFVQIIRDGRDVAVSFKTYKYGGDNVFDIALAWSRAVETGDRIGTLLGNRYHRLRYEDLIQSPEETLTNLCAFIGTRFDPSMLAYEKAVDRQIPKQKRDIWPILGKPLQQDRVERWRKDLSRGECAVFNAIAHETLHRFGYPNHTDKATLRGEIRGIGEWMLRSGRKKRLLSRFK